ncbi:response regulator transcription factor [Lysinibacillus sp. OL1_EC]|uniref:response regulator transcription factor n=1 Tax=Lysinibacillus TaxID=400634 RepID=UPI0002DB262A|nr:MULTISPECIES: response regulator transcription factor [Lysinibacillus]MCM0624856.1 response regulator transcription factor [Lysinibacillus sp. OL1_EC]MCS5502628.1 response regulator transcription factor [Lysinibacillus sp. A4]TBV87731.1 response regulator transcription factor [Lysinibacillus sp. OL1]UKJ45218.1 response regulator transcription factor [Lysinibacillus sp. ACHW1.5]WBF58166.1 response regulator transcription factor [Lysinibacillus sp. JK80]
MIRILYIEDEKEIGQWVSKELTERGYDVTWLESGEGLEQHINSKDIAILDVMLPGLDGFSIGKRIKRENKDLPILMLSARTAVEDKIEGLHFADDYLTKPFHPDELVARLEVLLRRYQKSDDVLTLQHLKIDTKDMQIINTIDEEEILLTGKQFYLLQYFIRHLNQILTKEQLYEGVWGESYIEGDKTLMVHIRYLREKIEINPAKPMIIETIRGIGYRVKQ